MSIKCHSDLNPFPTHWFDIAPTVLYVANSLLENNFSQTTIAAGLYSRCISIANAVPSLSPLHSTCVSIALVRYKLGTRPSGERCVPKHFVRRLKKSTGNRF